MFSQNKNYKGRLFEGAFKRIGRGVGEVIRSITVGIPLLLFELRFLPSSLLLHPHDICFVNVFESFILAMILKAMKFLSSVFFILVTPNKQFFNAKLISGFLGQLSKS